MKRIFNIILAMALLLALTACGGNFVQVDLKEPIAISEEGVIEKSILDKVKADNAIATFTGVSNNIKYEWTIFGSDITETRDINLALDLEETERGLTIVFRETENLGFPVLLSIHLNEKWTADSATAYDGDTAIYSVSITGSKTSILNMSVSTMIEKCTVLPDDTMYAESIPTEKQEVVYDETTKNETVQSDKQDRTETNKKDIYLSTVKDEDDRVYTEYSQNTTQSSTGTNQKDEYLCAFMSLLEGLDMDKQCEIAVDIIIESSNMIDRDYTKIIQEVADFNPKDYKRWYDKNPNIHIAIESLRDLSDEQRDEIVKKFSEKILNSYPIDFEELDN